MLSLKSLKVYLHIFYYNFLAILAYPYELLITVLEPALEIGFLALFWSMVAKASNHPIDLVSMLAYFIMVQFISIWAMNPGGLNFSSYLGYRVKTGLLSQTLVRPTRTLPTLLFEHRGFYCVDMIFSLILLGIALKLIGKVEIVQLGWFLVFLVLSFVITFSLCVLIGSLAFITKEINSIRHSISHLVRILSGAMVPLTFFPEKTREILNYTPFPSMMFSPINVLQNKLPTSLIIFNFQIAIIWAIVLLSLTVWVWHHNLRKYEATGI